MSAGTVVLNQYSLVLGKLVNSAIDASSTINSALPIMAFLPS
jgi:hypothetical protein